MLAHEYLQLVLPYFKARANPEKAVPMARYMRDQFLFYGIQSPQQKEILSAVIADHGLPSLDILPDLCQLCFQEAERELHYFACDLLDRQIKKLEIFHLDVVEALITTKSWWDSVDVLAPRITGKLLVRFPDAISNYPDRWIEADNFWLQRAAILFQLNNKDKVDSKRLYQYILRRADSKEFFVQKAAGWALRNYSKVNPESVKSFIQGHDLPALTQREGLKWLKKKGGI